MSILGAQIDKIIHRKAASISPENSTTKEGGRSVNKKQAEEQLLDAEVQVYGVM